MARTWYLNDLTPLEARQRLGATGRLIIPAGTLEPRGDHLPLATDTIILERLADELSARTGAVCAPAIPFGARSGGRRGPPGVAALARKTLHRVINELIAAWEEDAGVREVLLITAHAAEAHMEALGAIRTIGTVRVVDVFGMDFSGLMENPEGPLRGGELDTSLMLFIRPDLMTDPDPITRFRASAEKGERILAYILDRVAEVWLSAPVD